MPQTTSLPILLTLDELLYNLLCLTTASVHIVSLYPQRLYQCSPLCHMTAQCPHEAWNVTDHSFTPGQHNIFIKFFHAVETFVVILWVKLQEADGTGTLLTWGVPKQNHFCLWETKPSPPQLLKKPWIKYCYFKRMRKGGSLWGFWMMITITFAS